MMNEAFRLGYEAACNGLDYEDNPFNFESEEYGEWMAGFSHAEMDMADWSDYNED